EPCLAQLLAGHLQEQHPVTGVNVPVPLDRLPGPEVRMSLTGVAPRPLRRGRHHSPPASSGGLGISSPSTHPLGNGSSWVAILLNSSGETSTITDGYGTPLAGAGPKLTGNTPDGTALAFPSSSLIGSPALTSTSALPPTRNI